ncbi:hypothetical protein D5272_02595 [bacterium D16-76]|nr:hypothetical protein [bacterium D16-76]
MAEQAAGLTGARGRLAPWPWKQSFILDGKRPPPVLTGGGFYYMIIGVPIGRMMSGWGLGLIR